MEKLTCISCKKRVAGEGLARFKCPSCGESEIVRCPNCRQNAARYKCPSCGFTGPN